MKSHSTSGQDGWFTLPGPFHATRARGARLRAEAEAQNATVLDFSQVEGISAACCDELVGKGDWIATTGENENVRETVVAVLRRRGKLS